MYILMHEQELHVINRCATHYEVEQINQVEMRQKAQGQ